MVIKVRKGRKVRPAGRPTDRGRIANIEQREMINFAYDALPPREIELAIKY